MPQKSCWVRDPKARQTATHTQATKRTNKNGDARRKTRHNNENNNHKPQANGTENNNQNNNLQ